LEASLQIVLSEDDKILLLRLAREALESAANRQRLQPLNLTSLPSQLKTPCASFVTLTKKGVLRGCIGTLDANLPLAEDVRQRAAAAALYDPRFIPVTAEEVDQISIEISVLTPAKPLKYKGRDELLHLLRPGIDGVMLTDGTHRATFLPQVWEKASGPASFLKMLCEKAGLEPDAWQSQRLKISTYQVVKFQENLTSKE
jgi:AmmeMemoRadiSam system protein A